MAIQVGKVSMIPIELINIGERARKELGDLSSLETSLKASGLIQPLAVKQDGDRYMLLAGERRYTVLISNGVNEIPVRIYPSDISELEMKMIEKAENFYRKDMTYYEYDALIAEIDTLQRSIKGDSHRGPGSTGHKLKDTAEMFGVSDVSVHNAIKRHEAREAFPELFENCKSQKDAITVLKKVSDAAVKQSIAAKIECEKTEGTTLAKLANSYIQGDFLKEVKKIPNEIIQFIEIDPPYAIDLRKVKKSGNESQYIKDEYNEVDIKVYHEFLTNTFKECYRVMAPHSWLVCWFAPEPWFESIYDIIITTGKPVDMKLSEWIKSKKGLQTNRMVGVWAKPSAQTLQPTIRLANSYEMFFYVWKGQPILNKPGSSNLFTYSTVPPTQKTHPTERPIDLIKDIYNTFAQPGSRVMIPFLGSGSGLIAAYHLGMEAFGFELSKSYRDSFLVRVNNGI